MQLAVMTGVSHMGAASLQDRMPASEKPPLSLSRHARLLTPVSGAITGLVADTAATTMTLGVAPRADIGAIVVVAPSSQRGLTRHRHRHLGIRNGQMYE